MKEGSHTDLVTPMGLVNDITALLIFWSEQLSVYSFYRQPVRLLRKTIATNRRVDILYHSICVRAIVLNTVNTIFCECLRFNWTRDESWRIEFIPIQADETNDENSFDREINPN